MDKRGWLCTLSALALGVGAMTAAPAVASSPTFFQLSDNGGPDDQSGFLNLIVGPGSLFGFYIDSTDDGFGPAQATVTADFSGPFSLPWTLDTGGGNGSVLENPPTSFTLFGSDNSGADGGVVTRYFTGTSEDPPFSFTWQYHTDDVDGAFYNRFGYFCTDCSVVQTPEPAGVALLALSAGGLLALRRRRAA
jgi:hypothetical protein